MHACTQKKKSILILSFLIIKTIRCQCVIIVLNGVLVWVLKGQRQKYDPNPLKKKKTFHNALHCLEIQNYQFVTITLRILYIKNIKDCFIKKENSVVTE